MVSIFGLVETELAALLLSALTYIVGLAWNNAVTTYFRERFKVSNASAFQGQIIYALIVTGITIAAVLFVTRYLGLNPQNKLF